jgi:nicotinate phosphoribosyltransferase
MYQGSLALLTDLYQLTMAYGYWKKGMADRESVFHLFFRKKPFQGSFAIAAGLESAIDFIQSFRFDASDLAYLEGLKDQKGGVLFETGFLDYLKQLKFACDVDAMPEGTAAFPHQPLVRVKGPLLQAQLLESPLLNLINFPTLIATKAARICFAARPDEVIEFGMRRAQGIDGAITASRAAFIGGCKSTSNAIAGKLFGIPVRGTHAHSWIMAFETEQEAFDAYAEVMPQNGIYLVDTYDSLEGTRRAIAAAKKRGADLGGVRLDSGDLTALSIPIRKMLDAAGFTQAKILASNELDETLIADMKHQGSKVDLWGVGTHLVTGKEQPALDGVYKLAAIRDKGGKWRYTLKLSETAGKVTTPGILQVRRFRKGKRNLADMIYDSEGKVGNEIVESEDPSSIKMVEKETSYVDLLAPVFRKGKLVYQKPTLLEIQKRAEEELSHFDDGVRRFLNPQRYCHGIERGLYELKSKMKEQARV